MNPLLANFLIVSVVALLYFFFLTLSEQQHEAAENENAALLEGMKRVEEERDAALRELAALSWSRGDDRKAFQTSSRIGRLRVDLT